MAFVRFDFGGAIASASLASGQQDANTLVASPGWYCRFLVVVWKR